MRINNNRTTYKPPFQVIVLDAMDAFYYADVMDRMELFDTLESYELAVALADALFVVKNYRWESLDAMNSCDGGYDVRVYDQDLSCVYAAHTRFIEKWIGKQENL